VGIFIDRRAGNVDAEQYSSGEGTHYLTDTDAVMASFYTYCHRAGPKLCAFHNSSPSAIETRLTTLLAKLKTYPVIVPASSSSNGRPEIITYSKVRKVISSSLYRPLVMFPGLAEALAALESGDGRPFLELSSQGQEELPLCDSNNTPETGEPSSEIPEVEGSADASRAILCSDQAPFEGGVEAFGHYLEGCENASRSAGATMASMRLGCVEWAIKAKWRFSGPFGANKRTPILFVGNTADNITPLLSAHQNARRFPGSMVLKQNSYGVSPFPSLVEIIGLTVKAYIPLHAISLHGKDDPYVFPRRDAAYGGNSLRRRSCAVPTMERYVSRCIEC
jgi:TAP-like protein